ncbi:hypothetical protein pb186bvf_007791 [Paramecium bursaria]
MKRKINFDLVSQTNQFLNFIISNENQFALHQNSLLPIIFFNYMLFKKYIKNKEQNILILLI